MKRATGWDRAMRLARLLAIVWIGVACRAHQAAPTMETSPTVTSSFATEAAVAPTTVVATAAPATTTPSDEEAQASLRELTIFYTNDEHGWMEGMEPGMGAANLMGLWRAAGYEEDGSYLVLSGGDMWTGPAISTWFEGESMAEVLNAMDYAAAAVGNHEFDFGLEALRARSLESDFPFLSANVRDAGGETPREWGIEPYAIVERNGIQVGIIGLTTTSTPVTTNPTNVQAFHFLDYEQALREVTPQVRADGAKLLVVTGHLCRNELEALAQKVRDLHIQFMGGGHCNELFAETIAGAVLVEGGYHLRSYARADLLFDTASDTLVEADAVTGQNDPASAPDERVAAIVSRWQAQAEEELNVVIGYSEHGLPRRSDK
ncbi:MAG TPA: metallophosphatase, partial [Candidatus Binatia bacterium]|nr:metallophosphatase [Candidatus Binatia bacterium]